MKSYPITLKERKQILSHEDCESNIQMIIYDFGYSEEEYERKLRTRCNYFLYIYAIDFAV